ncbi:hypothetical protein DFH07DRAFT_874537 [Mycena maculata]|uniref:Protein kinase domain-containing protein n=1 Tax=Mycena maculata TaxID=230809 RepID=A0AAD7KDL8_9AGAR|nr:hypothetical protein DFH07DRAFT_874537 [Mycena maculata]
MTPAVRDDTLRKTLTDGEMVWVSLRDWLKEKGYVLRAKYQEGWVPSTKKRPFFREEDLLSMHASIMDATRIQDGASVMMKLVDKKEHPFEVEIATWFSAEPQRSDPQNHCIPVYEVLQVPDKPNKQILVMPVLTRYDKPRFDTVGEAVSFFRQIFEGMKYMHTQNVVHRDCMHMNIMMDASPIVTAPFHPLEPRKKRDFTGRTIYLSRTQHPVKYYVIDFGVSVKYKAGDRPPLEPVVFGGDRTVPEFQGDVLPKCDPFPVDVYYIGNLLREEFTEGSPYVSRKRGFEFMEPLVADMVNTDPALRPTMEEVVDRFEEIVHSLSSWKLRSRVAKDKDSFGITYIIAHWMRRLQLVVGRYSPIPMP